MSVAAKDTMISLPEAARRLRQPWSRVWDLVLRGELEGEKIGARWFVSIAAIEQLERERAGVAR